jgi:hypothetical protein
MMTQLYLYTKKQLIKLIVSVWKETIGKLTQTLDLGV